MTTYNNEHIDTDTKQNGLIVILDWDDTLLPSSYINTKGYHLHENCVDDNEQIVFKECEAIIIRFLKEIAKYSQHIFVLTNAEAGWVEMSTARFYPNLCADEIFKKIVILSARSDYEICFPNDPFKWKLEALRKNINTLLLSKTYKHVIGIGDSHYERVAIRKFLEEHPGIYIKNIKLMDKPTHTQLLHQIKMLTDNMKLFFDHDDHLDLQCTIVNNITHEMMVVNQVVEDVFMNVTNDVPHHVIGDHISSS